MFELLYIHWSNRPGVDEVVPEAFPASDVQQRTAAHCEQFILVDFVAHWAFCQCIATMLYDAGIEHRTNNETI
jgi:hypothetical protein